MIRRLKQCLLLYLREPGFMILSLLGFFSLCAIHAVVYWGIQRNLWSDKILKLTVGENTHLEIILQKYMLGDDLLTLIFVLGSFAMLAFGLLIKKQFANHRASLLPGYRKPHVIALGILLFIFIVVTIGLSTSAMQMAQIFFLHAYGVNVSLWTIYLVILIIAMGMLYVGYLSILYLFVVAYILLSIYGTNIGYILKYLSMHPWINFIAMMILGCSVVLFIARLMSLRSESFEYSFVLTWPPQKTLRNQMVFQRSYRSLSNRFLKKWHLQPKENKIRPYYKKQRFWARAGHWRYCQETNIRSLLLFSFIALPFYFIFLKSSAAEFFMTNSVETNFLLFAGAPVLLTIFTNYKSMLFWNYDLLKPVSRKDFLKQHGFKFFRDLFCFWFIIAVYFAVLPDGIRGTQQMGQAHFWAFLFLTFPFSWVVLGWIGVLSALQNERTVITSGFFLIIILMLEFFLAGRTTTRWILLNAVLCFIAGILFSKLAYEKWLNKEF